MRNPKHFTILYYQHCAALAHKHMTYYLEAGDYKEAIFWQEFGAAFARRVIPLMQE